MVLVRSAISCRHVRAAAQAAGRRLADRPAAQSGGEPEDEKRPENVRPRIERMLGHDIRFRMDIGLQLPVPAHGQASSMNASSLRATPRTWSRRSARAAQIPGVKTRRTGVETRPGAAARRAGNLASKAMTPSGPRRRTRTSANPPATDFMAPVTRQEARLRQAVLSLAKETEFGKRTGGGIYHDPSGNNRLVSAGTGTGRRLPAAMGGRPVVGPSCRTCLRSLSFR